MKGVVLALAVVGCGRIGFDATAKAAPPDVAAPDAALIAASCMTPLVCSGDDCCKTLPVPGGTFARSYDLAGDLYTDAEYTATVGDFHLDKYEVTVGRFRAFLDAGYGIAANPPLAGTGAHAAIANSGWNAQWNSTLQTTRAALEAAFVTCDGSPSDWTPTVGANEDLPLTCVSRHEAFAFCIWDGGYLPSEAEWNYAAAGGGDQRAYPWSDPASSTAIDATRAVYQTTVAPVGSKPAGDARWGQSDLAGNVWEWTLDLWTTPYAQTPCDNCANTTTGTNWVVAAEASPTPPRTCAPRFAIAMARCNRTHATPTSVGAALVPD